MTDPTSSDRLVPRTADERPTRPQGRDRACRARTLRRVLAPERRSRRKPILFVHGELGGSWVWERFLHHFAGRGWEGHALNLRNHFWSQTADPGHARHRVLHRGCRRGDGAAGSQRGGRRARHGRAARAQGHRAGSGSAYVLIAPETPRELREPARAHVVRDIPDAYGRAELGWETLPEKLTREHRDLTLNDVLRIQHLMGQKPFESGRAKRQMLSGVPVDRAALPDVPRLVIGGGLDLQVPEPEVERLAEWLDAPYEPFGAHSHYGLVLGEDSYLQVVETLRAFLEANRL